VGGVRRRVGGEALLVMRCCSQGAGREKRLLCSSLALVVVSDADGSRGRRAPHV